MTHLIARMLQLAPLPVLAVVALGVAPLASAQHSSKMSANPAQVLTAGALGTTGQEWLSGGAVLANGDILIAGVTLDNDITLLGKQAAVLGTDQKPGKPLKKWKRMGETETGYLKGEPTGSQIDGGEELPSAEELLNSLGPIKTKEEKKAEARAARAKLLSVPAKYKWKIEENSAAVVAEYSKLHWFQPEATGFWMVLSPDLKQVKAIHRMPRRAGSITDVHVMPDGAVYFVGAASKTIGSFAKPTRTERVPNPKGVNDKTFGGRKTYLARLSPNADQVEWLVLMEGWSIAPKLFPRDNGQIVVHGPGVRTYAADGGFVRHVSVENTRVLGGLAVSPVDGRFTRVGDWFSPTGREAYRTPRCNIHDEQGETIQMLWGWRGPFTGIDACRLVADSAIRKSVYDTKGNLITSSWSHGGNNVMFRYPYDIERMMPNTLRYQTNSTCAMLTRMDDDHDVIGSTVWGGYTVLDLGMAADDSPVIIGSGISNERLPNDITVERKGRTLMVADPNLDAVRFHSFMTNLGGRVALQGCYLMPDSWNFGTGVSNGRTLLIAVGSTNEPPKNHKDGPYFPAKDALQDGFAGGLADGYLLILDLTADQPFKPFAPAKRERKVRDYTDPLAWPQDGQRFETGYELNPANDNKRYRNARLTFRDKDEVYWPTFYEGDAQVGGGFTYGETEAKMDLTVEFKGMLQVEGDQSKRTLGELVVMEEFEATDKKGQPITRVRFANPATLRLTSSGPWERLPTTQVRRVGGVYCPQAKTTVSGELKVGDKTIPIQDARCTTIFKTPKDVDPTKTLPNHAMLTVRFEVAGSQLGLTGDLSGQTIKVQAQFSARYGDGKVGGW